MRDTMPKLNFVAKIREVFVAALFFGLAFFGCAIDFTSTAQAEQKAAPKKQPKVEVLLTDWCPYCQKTEQFLKSHSIEYERVNIEKSREGYNTYKTLGGGGIPIVKIGTNVIHGFDEAAMSEALGLHGD